MTHGKTNLNNPYEFQHVRRIFTKMRTYGQKDKHSNVIDIFELC